MRRLIYMRIKMQSGANYCATEMDIALWLVQHHLNPKWQTISAYPSWQIDYVVFFSRLIVIDKLQRRMFCMCRKCLIVASPPRHMHPFTQIAKEFVMRTQSALTVWRNEHDLEWKAAQPAGCVSLAGDERYRPYVRAEAKQIDSKRQTVKSNTTAPDARKEPAIARRHTKTTKWLKCFLSAV